LDYNHDNDDTSNNPKWWKSYISSDKPCITFEIYFTGYINNNTKLIKSNPIIVNLKCRDSLQSFVFTYKDHDGSVAHSAAIKPRNLAQIEKESQNSKLNNKECNNHIKYNVVLSLSGVGVSARGQADSHKYKVNPSQKDYTFGFDNAWILTPQRNGAHNWEGIIFNFFY
jgi:hypothetical protein